MPYDWLLYVHVISATLLFGTGLGTAFHGWMAHRSRNVAAIVVVGRNVVLADWLFTTPAAIVQPITGVWMAHRAGYPMTTGWLALAIGLYAAVGACWLPVVWLQIRMHSLARIACGPARRCRRPTSPAPASGSRWGGPRSWACWAFSI